MVDIPVFPQSQSWMTPEGQLTNEAQNWMTLVRQKLDELSDTGGGEVASGYIISGTVLTPDFTNFNDVVASSGDYAVLIDVTKSTTINGLVYVNTSTWTGMTIGLFKLDETSFSLGEEVVSATVASAAAGENVESFSDIDIDAGLYWLAFGGGSGNTKLMSYNTNGTNGFPTPLSTYIGSPSIDTDPTSGTLAQLPMSADPGGAPVAAASLSTTSSSRLRPVVGIRVA